MHTAGKENMHQILFFVSFLHKICCKNTPHMQVWPECYWEPTATGAKQPITANNEQFIAVRQDLSYTF